MIDEVHVALVEGISRSLCHIIDGQHLDLEGQLAMELGMVQKCRFVGLTATWQRHDSESISDAARY